MMRSVRASACRCTSSAGHRQPSSIDEKTAWRRLLGSASAAYRPAGRFAWKAAAGKLRFDPAFRRIVCDGLVPPQARVLDIGCGRGLLPSLLLAAGRCAAEGGWPPGWGAAPVGIRITGIERMAGDADLARTALGQRAEIITGDMVDTPLPPSEVVVMLDVLHYVDVDAQDRLLARARQAMPIGGRLLLRVGDAAVAGAFRRSQWVDRLVLTARGQRRLPMAGRPLEAWQRQLASLGFGVELWPLGGGTLFANRLLVATVGAAGTQAASTR